MPRRLGWTSPDCRFCESVSDEELRVCRQQATKGLNAPLTSSMGRLFDCVAALANVRTEVTYEGQAAMELEQMSNVKSQISNASRDISFGLRDGEISLKSLLAEVIEDVRRGVDAGEIGAKFHRTMAEMILAVCQRISERNGPARGGAFRRRVPECHAAGADGSALARGRLYGLYSTASFRPTMAGLRWDKRWLQIINTIIKLSMDNWSLNRRLQHGSSKSERAISPVRSHPKRHSTSRRGHFGGVRVVKLGRVPARAMWPGLRLVGN